MIKKCFLSLLIICSFSCENDDKQKFNNGDTITSTNLETNITNKIYSTTNKLSSLDLAIEVQDFIICKNTAKLQNQCKNSFTKTISKAFRLTEFGDQKIGYILYDSIHPIVEHSKKWLQLGSINQKTIDQALAHANRGGLALIIDTAKPSGHVVMIVSGGNKESASWNMKLPKVLSMVNDTPEKSFSNKLLSDAMKKSDALKIFLRQ